MYLVFLALAPVIYLLYEIYKADRLKEPTGLLIKLFIGGLLSVIPAVFLELMLDEPIKSMFNYNPSVMYYIVEAFVGVALIEEGCKYIFLRLFSWNNPNFDDTFDGIIYAVFVSLGFAALENILYVIQGGITVAVSRALLSIPGHMCFSIVMGFYYSRAKRCAVRGDGAGVTSYTLKGLFGATFCHGFYDACAVIGSNFAMILFFAFVIAMFYFCRRIVLYESVNDQHIY